MIDGRTYEGAMVEARSLGCFDSASIIQDLYVLG